MQATTLREALDNLTEGMKETISNYEVVALSETPLMDVYKVNLAGKAQAAGPKAE